ncbi:hypothetical protein A3B18_01220 [Candidatus Giovannonibacteria bacterium RIFCSPLOWO2_01_FULL_46_13]|uniref:Arginine--tRNA ligase n=1 Tax=Candidatus Giovannonibacteria bacterium RIFCSPLOWO2_01_FULL_46_13 TaxID=1798352 RepID=A0A1F5X3V0_9BACT|nr:MAG: hypothetical protein A3B18_01220 [Candidatus Giovannonibacteria bacterium RIFCSPLOWO2_01_FULL_46_13]
MLRDELKKEILKISGLQDAKITEPEHAENGDWTTNAAFSLAKKIGKSPNDAAEDLADKLRSEKSDVVDRAESVGGFINIWIKDEVLLLSLGVVTKIRSKNTKINLEFVSANPTGPLTMANGRGGFYGDALANILEKTGYDVTREYYINDAGNQVRLLGESIEAAEGKREDKEEYYKGEYVKELAGKSPEEAIQFLVGEIKKSLEKAGIKFNVWFSESKLREKKEPEKVLKFLEDKNLIEKKDGAVWLGEAVLVKSDGEYTYFLVDLAYHWNKFFDRKFDMAVDIWGADHHGYVERMKKGVEVLGIGPEKLKIIIMQLVRLMSGGKEVKMSKRAGTFVTMEELLDEVGVDVARWFFLERSPNTHMDFDLDLAKEKSEKNPVFYVQYAYVRMLSILRNSHLEAKLPSSFGYAPERDLALKILRWPEILEDTSCDYQVHRLTTYAYELAQAFSAFYRDVKVIGSDREAELLYLVSKAKETLTDVLKTLGISQPEKM